MKCEREIIIFLLTMIQNQFRLLSRTADDSVLLGHISAYLRMARNENAS